MNNRFMAKIALILMSLMLAFPAFSSDLGCEVKIKLQDYEANTVGIVKDDNDEQNIDFKLSQMVPIFHDGCNGAMQPEGWFFRPYFAFTGRFGFYALGGRDSKPVIGKSFNPKFFARHWIGVEDEYIDLGYAHESNGQSINTEAAYLQKRADVIAKGDRADFASDYLSRGWDYLDMTYKMKNMDNSYFTSYAYLKLKYFLAYGLFQGDPEETYSWETNEGKSRAEVDGVSVLLKSTTFRPAKDSGVKFAVIYTTGYERMFVNNTLRVEATLKLKEWLPIQVWFSSGYNADLIDYYKDTTSFGIGLELRNFMSDI